MMHLVFAQAHVEEAAAGLPSLPGGFELGRPGPDGDNGLGLQHQVP